MKEFKPIFLTLITIFSLIQFSQAQNTWTQKADFGGGFVAASTAFSIGNKAYMGTGFDAISQEALNSFWEYDAVSDTWSQKANVGGSPRAYALSFGLETKGYIGGGFDGVDAFTDFWEYNPANNTWTQKANMAGPARLAGSSFSIDNKGYIGLGYNFDDDEDLKDFWEYNPTNNTWTQKATFGGHERESAASFSAAGKGYIGTGYDYLNDVDLSDVWEYNPSNNTWSQKADFGGTQREFASGFNIGGNGYIACGYDYDNDLLLKDLWEFNPSTNTWAQKAGLPALERQIATAFSVGSKGYISSGYNFDIELNDLWQYTPSNANQAPVANAGSDVSIELPVNSTMLNGSGTDSDGTITIYSWSQVGNSPSTATILNSLTATPTVSDLIAGIYTFRLTVTDDDGDIDTDDVLVTVTASGDQPPIADAGADIVIQLPVNSTLLDGMGIDLDGTIEEYAWSQDINNPSSAGISDPSIANPVVSGLIEGTYIFILTVTDDDGLTDSDEVMVTVNPAVNQPPVANAGSDINIILPVDAAQLNGSGIDPEGNLISFEWEQVGTSPSSATISDIFSDSPIVSDLIYGVYTFKLTVTDDQGLTGIDEVNVFVDSVGNMSPIADAGLDTTLILPTDSTELAGSGTDADGTIIGYEWEQVGITPSIAIISDPTIPNPLVSGLIEGTYSFRLTVIDDNGSTASDDVSVFVVDTNNHAPLADAGLDIELTLPLDTVEVNGSGTDVDGTIVSYSWDQVGDTPSIATISDSTIVDPVFSDLIEGTYTFVLTVTDDDGAVGMDTLLVIVHPVLLLPPVANAGDDIYVYLPTDSTKVNGSGTDEDGMIVSFAWQQVGDTPSIATISDTTLANPVISDLIQGTYTFTLTVTDNDGLIGIDTLLIIVDTLVLEAPVADAGDDITITSPVSTVILNGDGVDPDGTIVEIQWAQMGSTPSFATISDATSYTPTVSNLVEGTYTFVLMVTDNDGLTDTDTMNVIVNPAVNEAPVANAGADIVIILPVNSTSLNGSGTDADGTITSYAWEQVGSTPNNATIIGISTPNPTVASLVKGTYTFRLTVTDNDNATATDEVNVIVEADLATTSLDIIPPTVYPNPAPGGKVYIDPGNMVKIGSRASVINAEGKVLQSFVIGSSKQELDLSSYSSGSYFIQFDNGMRSKVIVME